MAAAAVAATTAAVAAATSAAVAATAAAAIGVHGAAGVHGDAGVHEAAGVHGAARSAVGSWSTDFCSCSQSLEYHANGPGTDGRAYTLHLAIPDVSYLSKPPSLDPFSGPCSAGYVPVRCI